MGRKLPIPGMIAEAILDYSDAHGWNEKKVNFLDEDNHKKIMDFYSDSNQKISDLYLEGMPVFMEPFKSREMSETTYDYSKLDPEELLKLNAYILRRIFG